MLRFTQYSGYGWQKNEKKQDKKKNIGNCKAPCVSRKRNKTIDTLGKQRLNRSPDVEFKREEISEIICIRFLLLEKRLSTHINEILEKNEVGFLASIKKLKLNGLCDKRIIMVLFVVAFS